jgi:hypothetical protein
MSIVFSDEESALLDRIAIEVELARLSPLDRTLIELRFGTAHPDDFTGRLPAGKGRAGAYAGRKYLGQPLAPTQAWERTTRILDQWKRRYHDDQPVPSNTPCPVTPLRPPLPLSSPPLRKAA